MPKPIFTTTLVARGLQQEGTTTPILNLSGTAVRMDFRAAYLVHYRPNGILNAHNPDHDLAVAYDI